MTEGVIHDPFPLLTPGPDLGHRVRVETSARAPAHGGEGLDTR